MSKQNEKPSTFEEFESLWLNEVSIKRPKDIRAGQALMTFLAATWMAEYRRISDNYYKRPDLDCFYIDSFMDNLMCHLKKVWNKYPK